MRKICQLSPLNTCEILKKLYTHALLDVIYNSTKFELNWISTYNFQLKTDTALTLKCDQGHQKWYKQVKLKE